MCVFTESAHRWWSIVINTKSWIVVNFFLRLIDAFSFLRKLCLAGGGILCKEASLPKDFFRVRLSIYWWSSERNLGFCTYLVCGVWGTFLHFFSISGTKLIKIMCSKIIFGLRLTNWYKFQSDSERSFHFAKSAKRGVRVHVCVLGRCAVHILWTQVKMWPAEVLAMKKCLFSNVTMNKYFNLQVNQYTANSFTSCMAVWAKAPRLRITLITLLLFLRIIIIVIITTCWEPLQVS